MATRTLRLTYDARNDSIKAIDPDTGNGFYIAKLEFVDSDHMPLDEKKKIVADIIGMTAPITHYPGGTPL